MSLRTKKSRARANILAGMAKIYLGRIGAALPDLNTTTSDTLSFTTMGTNEVQTVTLAGPTAGTFTLTLYDLYGIAYTSAAIAYDADAATLQAAIDVALASLTGFTAADISVAGSAGGPYTLTYDGSSVSARPQNLLTIDGTGLTGGTPVTTRTTTGVSDWILAGFTENGIQLDITKEVETKRADQRKFPIRKFLSSLEGKYVFELADRDPAAFHLAAGAATISTQLQASGVSAIMIDRIGDEELEEFQVVLEGKSPQNKPMLYHSPICVSEGNLSDKWMRGKATNLSVEVGVLADDDDDGNAINRYSMAAPALA